MPLKRGIGVSSGVVVGDAVDSGVFVSVGVGDEVLRTVGSGVFVGVGLGAGVPAVAAHVPLWHWTSLMQTLPPPHG